MIFRHRYGDSVPIDRRRGSQNNQRMGVAPTRCFQDGERGLNIPPEIGNRIVYRGWDVSCRCEMKYHVSLVRGNNRAQIERPYIADNCLDRV
jgi:hypothetical protein